MSRTGCTLEIVPPISIVAGATGMGPIKVRRIYMGGWEMGDVAIANKRMRRASAFGASCWRVRVWATNSPLHRPRNQAAFLEMVLLRDIF